jgi:hypothetical protein
MWNFLFTYTFKIIEYVQDTVVLKQKKRPVLDIIGFFFRMSTQVKAEVRSVIFFIKVHSIDNNTIFVYTSIIY